MRRAVESVMVVATVSVDTVLQIEPDETFDKGTEFRAFFIFIITDSVYPVRFI
jgi:hypothetical protein